MTTPTMKKKKQLNVVQPGREPQGSLVKENLSYETQTQAYSTWGGKLLQHTDVLYGIQVEKKFKPITIQLGPTEACFTGETRVQLMDGTVSSLKELAETKTEPFWVYSYDISTQSIVPGKALRSRVTRHNVPVVNVTLDNGEAITCTPDHEFLLKNGTYLKASELSVGESLMSFYKKYVTVDEDKVVSVTSAGTSKEVYCLEVEKYHNFALAAGVFVSNCDSNCPFCSVSWRPVDKKIPWASIEKGLREFRELGAKSVEITGSGNPLLYKDGDKNINHVIELAHSLGYEIGIITNTEKLSRHIKPENADKISWIRISLIKLDEGKIPEDYNFEGFDVNKMGFSYIIYDGTTVQSIEKIAKLVELNPEVKFVRIASDCLTEQSLTIKKDWGDIVKALDVNQKFFIKEINDSFHAFEGGCWVGMIRPYWVWNGVYICTSHVLKHRNYHDTWKLCDHDHIKATWDKMNERFAKGQNPYEIDVKGECFHCYYKNSNEILSFVINELPDKNFA